MREIRDIVIHCSATRANVDEKITLPGEDVGAREINDWHNKRGFDGLGYHYVIRRSGEVEPGRPLARAGAHVAGHNAESIGICLVGGVSPTGEAENNFEPGQWAALAALVGQLKQRWPQARVLGHRDYPGVRKDCPCFEARAWAKKEGLA